MSTYEVIVRDETTETITTVEVEATYRADAQVAALDRVYHERGWRRATALDAEEREQ